MMHLWVVGGAALVLMIGGVIKGIVGIGLPVFVVSVLSGFLPPHEVIAILIVPIIVSNIWQSFGTSNSYSLETLRRFWILILFFGVATYVGTKILVSVPTNLLLLIMGLITLVFCLNNWLKPQINLAPNMERWVGGVVGIVAGILNGVSMVNGPPLIVYLLSLGIDRERFVAVYGMIALCGSIPLAASLIGVGVVKIPQLTYSVIALLPVFVGLFIGKRLRRNLDQNRFRKLVLVILSVLGLNLIRRALF